MMTEIGEEADQIRRWAWEDPAGRAEEGLNRLHDLAETTENEQERREIGDSVRMLSRLQGTLVHDVTGIFDQIDQPQEQW